VTIIKFKMTTVKMMDYIVYFHLDTNYYLDQEGKVCKTDRIRDVPSKSRFMVLAGYEANDDGLKKFSDDFKIWVEQLLKNRILDIEYTKYYTHRSATLFTLKRLSPLYRQQIFDDIGWDESEWIESCYNGGLIYLDESIKGKPIECYGYDFTGFYPRNMTNIDIPISCGREVTLSELPEKLQFGFYRCSITSQHPDASKVFAYSTKDTYTHICVRHARHLGLTITLIQDGKPNAYLYDKTVKGRDLFGNWHRRLNALKKKFPKNRLVKHLMSSAWGLMCQKSIKEVRPEDASDDDVERIVDMKYYGDNIVFVVKQDKPYLNGAARLKPFLTAYSRSITSTAACHVLQDVVRIKTDGIVLKKEHPELLQRYKTLHPEDKTTGTILWYRANSYQKVVLGTLVRESSS
jgi:hypothetical protein